MPMQQPLPTPSPRGKAERTACGSCHHRALSFVVPLFLLYPAVLHAHGPADDDNQLCRALHLDETSLSAAAMPTVTWGEARDFTSLLSGTMDDDDAPASLRFEAWVLGDTTTACGPTVLTLTGAGREMNIAIPAPDKGWAPGQWHQVEVPLSSDDRHHAMWGSPASLDMRHDCPPNDALSMKIKLARVCKALPVPSLCTVVTTTTTTSDCGACAWQTALCCESRPFTFCTAATTYGVTHLAPAASLVQGGAHVVVTSATSFVATPHMACRFGEAVVPATLRSARTLACVAPPADHAGAVTLDVSLDGGQQWTQSGHQFHYCRPGDDACLAAADEDSIAKPAAAARAAASDPSSSLEKQQGCQSTAAAMRQGLLLGISLCVGLAVLGSVVLMYLWRAKLGEVVLDMLANTRFGSAWTVDGEEDESHDRVRGWNPTVELTSAMMPPLFFRLARLSPQQVRHFHFDDEEETEMEEIVVL